MSDPTTTAVRYEPEFTPRQWRGRVAKLRRYQEHAAGPIHLYARTTGGTRIHRRTCSTILDAVRVAETCVAAGRHVNGWHG